MIGCLLFPYPKNKDGSFQLFQGTFCSSVCYIYLATALVPYHI